LFQTARRFNIGVQPQLVMLQKTLLNIEGLGRQLDPDLDLWSTAKPYLERWMSEQVGWRGILRALREEAPYWSEIVPRLPRLLHESLSRPPQGTDLDDLRMQVVRQERNLRWLSAALVAVAVLAMAEALLLGRLF
jgi:ubiquinone biosynthesis protein